MIKSKEDFRSYRAADLAANKFPPLRAKDWVNPGCYLQRWHYLLRRVEYLLNCRPRGVLGRIELRVTRYRFDKLSAILGISIAPNVFGPGLSVPHYGSIVVNAKARVGANCRIHSSTNIGEGRGQVPVLGDNVYVGPGVKIFGGIRVGDNVIIGANSVVDRDVPDNVVVTGIPAKVVRETDSWIAGRDAVTA